MIYAYIIYMEIIEIYVDLYLDFNCGMHQVAGPVSLC